MGYCVNCFFQGDNSLDERGNGRIFCMAKKRWLSENESCPDFTEYADLSKETRCQYALELRSGRKVTSKMGDIVKESWKAMIITLIVAFVMFILAVKIFDKYIF